MTTINLNHETICVNPTDDLTLYDKNNIMSRIEKFLFAICSLDSSDLPVPLSRIEELYNCLVTGDTPPTFEPLSRAEKFLMACLGVYDINKLPEPLSRSEVLLKKIATGDSNLEDVDNLQSKYEFLLAYIIQNGGIGEFDEYILNTQFNTLYNTKEKMIKSAILKGQTMVNLFNTKNIKQRNAEKTSAVAGYDVATGTVHYITNIEATNSYNYSYVSALELGSGGCAVNTLKPNTTYTVKWFYEKIKDTDPSKTVMRIGLSKNVWGSFNSSYLTQNPNIQDGICVFTTPSEFPQDMTKSLSLGIINESNTIEYKVRYVVLEGDHTNVDIPYFEGMQSVKMPVLTTTGKNLFNIPMSNESDFLPNTFAYRTSETIQLKPNTHYTLSAVIKDYIGGLKVLAVGDGSVWVDPLQTTRIFARTDHNTAGVRTYTFTTTETGLFNLWYYDQDNQYNVSDFLEPIQLEEGSVATSYEPFKSNILTSGKTFTQSMFEQGSFKESMPVNTKPYEDMKINSSENSTFYSNRIRTTTTHKVISGTSYKVKINDGYGIFIGFCKNGLYSSIFSKEWTDTNITFTIPTDCDEMFFALHKIDNSDITVEDYPAMGLEIHQEVTLRGIGDVQDTLDLMTGEMVQKFTTKTYNGSEYWTLHASSSNLVNCLHFSIYENDIMMNGKVISPQIKTSNYSEIRDDEFISIGGSRHLHYIVNKNKLTSQDVNGFKQWLSQNPFTVQYQLATESVKTVDLSVVDQDGNGTKLSTFNDITHVTLSSEGLIPEAELEVATKNEEDLEDSSVYTVHTLSEEFNTLYNTEEKPVKSAILKGQTLVNLASEKNTSIGGEDNITCVLPYKVDKITVYFLDPTYSKFQYFEYDSEGTYIRAVNLNIPSDRVMFISLNGTTIGKIGYYNPNDINTTKNIVVMYGDTRDIKITKYFEGVQSVKMPVLTTTGKNLCSELEHGSIASTDGSLITSTTRVRNKDFITLGPDSYTISADENYEIIYRIYDMDGAYLSSSLGWGGVTLLEITEASKVKLVVRKKDDSDVSPTDDIKLQIEKGIKATTYEPYKSNILTTSEEVELRGIGKVKDELNLLTGELTQLIGEINTASMNTSYFSGYVFEPSGLYRMAINIENLNINGSIKCDKLPVVPFMDSWNLPYECIAIYTGGILLYLKDTPTIESFVNKATGLDLIIQYELATESIKTVDLSVVDQDGNDTKLSTFNDITHVTLSSEGLIPEAELEVAEKVPEIAASILTISREQEVIDSATNKQSENVDATMIATTEIYEGLL